MPAASSRLAPVEVRCQSCGAEITVPPEHLTGTCPYCDSPAVVDRPATRDRPDPEFVVPFLVGKAQAERGVRAHVQRRWLRPDDLERAAVDHVRGVYVPTYLYNAVAHSEWEARIGENYTEVETYTTRDAKGNVRVRTRTVTKTEHHRLRGRFAAYLVDVFVSASRGLANPDLEGLEPFDLRTMVRFEPGLVSGWVAEEPQLTRDECLRTAHDEGQRAIGRRLSGFMPGDSHHGLEHRTALSDEDVSLVLLPVWIFALRRDGAEPVQLYVNGQTGEVHGRVPRSGWKIALFVFGLLAVGGLLAGLFALLTGALALR